MAFCPNCGNQIPDDSRFCPNCGVTLQDMQQASFTRQNDYQRNQVNSMMPMNWYKFLIYFSLFVTALVYVYTAFQGFTGAQYGGSAALVYAYFKALKVVDMAMAISCVGLAVFSILVRQKLANYQSDGPKMLTILYVLGTIVPIIYVVLATAVIGDGSGEIISSMLPSVLGNIVMIFVNKKYFDNRKHLFNN